MIRPRVKLPVHVSTLFAILALVLALAAALVLLLAPFYTGVQTTAVGRPGQNASSPPVVEVRSATLLEVNGPGVLLPLVLPIALPALALTSGQSRFRRPAFIVGALLLAVFCLVSGFSIGLFYVPAALAMAAAALLSLR